MTYRFGEPGKYTVGTIPPGTEMEMRSTDASYYLPIPPKPQSKLRLVAGSDAVVINHPSPKPNVVVRWLTRILLRMEWLDAE